MIVSNIVEKQWLSKTGTKVYTTKFHEPITVYGSDNKNIELT